MKKILFTLTTLVVLCGTNALFAKQAKPMTAAQRRLIASDLKTRGSNLPKAVTHAATWTR
jgi:hypothetical protein